MNIIQKNSIGCFLHLLYNIWKPFYQPPHPLLAAGNPLLLQAQDYAPSKDALSALAPSSGLPNHLAAAAAQAHAQQHRSSAEHMFENSVKTEANSFNTSYPNCSPRSPTTRITQSEGKSRHKCSM